MLNLIIVLVLNSIFRLSEQLCAFIEQIVAQLHERISKWRDVRVSFVIVDVSCVHSFVSVLHRAWIDAGFCTPSSSPCLWWYQDPLGDVWCQGNQEHLSSLLVLEIVMISEFLPAGDQLSFPVCWRAQPAWGLKQLIKPEFLVQQIPSKCNLTSPF